MDDAASGHSPPATQTAPADRIRAIAAGLAAAPSAPAPRPAARPGDTT